jgi:hypothetical protein
MGGNRNDIEARKRNAALKVMKCSHFLKKAFSFVVLKCRSYGLNRIKLRNVLRNNEQLLTTPRELAYPCRTEVYTGEEYFVYWRLWSKGHQFLAAPCGWCCLYTLAPQQPRDTCNYLKCPAREICTMQRHSFFTLSFEETEAHIEVGLPWRESIRWRCHTDLWRLTSTAMV